jgi:hypothetical protein
MGGDQELIVALRTAAGDAWAGSGSTASRARRCSIPTTPMFDSDEIASARALGASLAEGARRALLLGEAAHRAASARC